MKTFHGGPDCGGLIGLIPGFGLGVYFLPIIVAEKGADETVLVGAMPCRERGMFVRDLPAVTAALWRRRDYPISRKWRNLYHIKGPCDAGAGLQALSHTEICRYQSRF